MKSHAPLVATLESKQAELAALKSEHCLFDCWIGRAKPQGTAGSPSQKRDYHRLQSRRPQFAGKKTLYLPQAQVADYEAAIARGKRVRQLEREIAKLVNKLDAVSITAA